MSCNHCDTKFNFFHKELGCSNCGIALCSKCIKQKCKIPSKGSGEFHVCRICFKKLTSSQPVEEEDESPPDKYLKRLQKRSLSIGSRNSNKQEIENEFKNSMSPADQDIADRLAKLKDKPTNVPSESDIRERLTNLKRDRVQINLGTVPFNTVDTRSEQEKVDSLLEQLHSEQGIENAYKPEDDLSDRLTKLKGEKPVSSNHSNSYIENEDSDDEVKKITKKVLAETSLEERCPVSTTELEDDAGKNDDELPWCLLCNDDAAYRCRDCEGDLFCKPCFIEAHKEWGMTDHVYELFKKK